MRKSNFEKMGGTYRDVNGYLIPNLTVDSRRYSIGKYGRLHERYIKEKHRCFYSHLLVCGKLLDYLEKVDCKAKTEVERLISLLAKKQGVTEKFKAENQLKWVGLMNKIKAQAEEFVCRDIVYKRQHLCLKQSNKLHQRP